MSGSLNRLSGIKKKEERLQLYKEDRFLKLFSREVFFQCFKTFKKYTILFFIEKYFISIRKSPYCLISACTVPVQSSTVHGCIVQ